MPILDIFDNPVVRIALAGIGTAAAAATGLVITDSPGSPATPAEATSAAAVAEAEAEQELTDQRQAFESRREILDLWGDDHCRIDIDVIDVHSGESVPAWVAVEWHSESTDDGQPETFPMPMSVDGATSFPVGCSGGSTVDILRLPDDYEPYAVISGVHIRFDGERQVRSHQIAVVRRGVDRWHDATVTAVVWDISSGEPVPYEGAAVRFVETYAFGRHDPGTGAFVPQFVTTDKETDARGIATFRMHRHIGELVLEESADYEIVSVDRQRYDWRPLPNSTAEVAADIEQMNFTVERITDGHVADDGHHEDDNAQVDEAEDAISTATGDDDNAQVDEANAAIEEAEDAISTATDDDNVRTDVGTASGGEAVEADPCDGEDASLNYSAGEIGRAMAEAWGFGDMPTMKRRALGMEVQRAVEDGDLCEHDVDALVDEQRETEPFIEWSTGLDVEAVLQSASD